MDGLAKRVPEIAPDLVDLPDLGDGTKDQGSGKLVQRTRCHPLPGRLACHCNADRLVYPLVVTGEKTDDLGRAQGRVIGQVRCLCLGPRAGACEVLALHLRNQVAPIQLVEHLVGQQFVFRPVAPGLRRVSWRSAERLNCRRKAGVCEGVRAETDRISAGMRSQRRAIASCLFAPRSKASFSLRI